MRKDTLSHEYYSLAIAVYILFIATVLNALVQFACASAPPNLSPAATTAFNQHRIQNVLDIARDVAIDGNKQIPPVFSTATTRKIVTWHSSAITLIHAFPQGWQALVEQGLDEAVKDLPPAEAKVFSPYVVMIKAILRGVTSGTHWCAILRGVTS